MIKLALLVKLEAKPGKEKEVEAFLQGGLDLVLDEPATITWYAFRLSESIFGIFDSFENEDGRNAHLNGEAAKALMQKAPDLFASAPDIQKAEVIAAKKQE